MKTASHTAITAFYKKTKHAVAMAILDDRTRKISRKRVDTKQRTVIFYELALDFNLKILTVFNIFF